jgi:hypothetical protein
MQGARTVAQRMSSRYVESFTQSRYVETSHHQIYAGH